MKKQTEFRTVREVVLQMLSLDHITESSLSGLAKADERLSDEIAKFVEDVIGVSRYRWHWKRYDEVLDGKVEVRLRDLIRVHSMLVRVGGIVNEVAYLMGRLEDAVTCEDKYSRGADNAGDIDSLDCDDIYCDDIFDVVADEDEVWEECELLPIGDDEYPF